MFVIKIFIVLMPWRIKRYLLQKIFKYKLDSSASIGLSWIYPSELTMDAKSRIDHFNVAINLDKIIMGANSFIGRNNWITGFSSKIISKHFQHQPERISALYLGDESAITKHHHIDCTNIITIGKFTTIAGYNSQLLTHSIDLYENRQSSVPISIGDYCFVGTNSVLLGGAVLPSHSVLGANSMLSKSYEEEWGLYGGNPAKFIKTIPSTAKYFTRTDGFVY